MKLIQGKVNKTYTITSIETDKDYLKIFGIEKNTNITINNKSLFCLTYKITISSNNTSSSFMIPRKYAKNILII